MSEANEWKEKIEATIDQTAQIAEKIKQIGTLASSAGVTDREKEHAYGLGYQFYQQKKYDKALVVFDALHMLDPLNRDFAKGMAATLQMMGNFPEAAMAYLMAYFYSPDDLELALLAGRCMMESSQFHQAYYILDSIVSAKHYQNSDGNQQILKSISTLKEILKKNMDRNTTSTPSKS